MSGNSGNLLSYGQIDADLFMAEAPIREAESRSSKAGKYLRGLAGYHLQQACEKLIKIQIYASGAKIDNAKMYRHALDDLIVYASSLGIALIIPKWIDTRKYIITGWEATGRYDLNFVVRLDTLKCCLEECKKWRKDLMGFR